MRKDGVRVTDLDSVHKIMPYLMANRCDAEVYSVEKIDITKLMDYLDEINEGKEKGEKVTLFHSIIHALAMTIYNRPLLNRFIAGRRFYERRELSFSFVAKNKLEDHSEERLIIFKPTNKMNVFDISNEILNIVSKTRKDNTNSMNDTLKFVTMFPRCIVSLIMWMFRKLDFYGLVPSFISDGDPNYSTVLLSNLGSIKAECCYHHLNNYGTNSIVSTIGVIHEEKVNGEAKEYVNIAFTLDERIADGIYFAKSIKLFKYIIENPKLLECCVSTKIDINDIN